MIKHTPGPLRAVLDRHDNGDGYSIETSDGRRIAYVWERASYTGANGKPTGKMEFGSDYAAADANLFVYATDMLEALKNWFVCADEHEVACTCGRDKARAAIAKVEGSRNGQMQP